MEFRDLRKQYKVMQEEIDHAVAGVLERSDFISGQEVQRLEEQLAEYAGVKHCITCGNGTDALQLALMAWGIGEGDAVFVPDFTFFASGEAPARCGATSVFVDVERDTFNLSSESLERAVKKIISDGLLKPKAVVAVDLFGQPADYERIIPVVQKYGLLLLEDGAQGFGGNITGRRACSFGDISTTSFFPAKPLGCYGDGGAVFTDNNEWADIIRSLCVHGKGKNKYDNVRIGMNSRLDTLPAAVLLVKFRHFQKYELGQVNQVAEWYASSLEDIVGVPVIQEGFYSSWAQFTILCRDKGERDGLQQELKDSGIPSMIYYGKGMHEQKAFSGRGIVPEKCNNTLYLKERVLSLPMHPYMDRDDVRKVAKVAERLGGKRIW